MVSNDWITKAFSKLVRDVVTLACVVLALVLCFGAGVYGLVQYTRAPEAAEPVFEDWYGAHVRRCNRCRNGDTCPAANSRLIRIRNAALRQWQEEQKPPARRWMDAPTHPGYWWRLHRKSGDVDPRLVHVIHTDQGQLGYFLDEPCLDWSRFWYCEQDVRKPETMATWTRDPVEDGEYLNWSDSRGYLTVRHLVADSYDLIDVTTGRSATSCGGLFLRIEPPEHRIGIAPPGQGD